MTAREKLFELHEPFPEGDVEWRLSHSGESNGKVWAMALCYITNRAIMERLDRVVGPENWRNQYRPSPGGGVLCGISIRIGDEWVTKWDGSGNMEASASPGGLSESDAAKGTLSGAMKRAAVQWGIGRYLYNLPEGWATCYKDTKQGRFRGKLRDKTAFSWDPPELPDWALPPQGQDTPTEPEDDSLLTEAQSLWIRGAGLGLDEHKYMKALDQAVRQKDRARLEKGVPMVRKLIEKTESAVKELDLEKVS